VKIDKSNLIIISDFDGTICNSDIGNEICKVVCPEKFFALIKEYKSNNISLRTLQSSIWNKIDCSVEKLKAITLEHSIPREGFVDFLKYCQQNSIPFYIASCGIDLYIEHALKQILTEELFNYISEIKSNVAVYQGKTLVNLISPDTHPDIPFHKGKWAISLKEKHQNKKVLAIGNGGSDKTFIDHVDFLVATDNLRKHCQENKVNHFGFDRFEEIVSLF